jgi:superfamily II DNA/RNA helicase
LKSFADLGTSEPVVRALTKRGITEPFPIQAAVIADALAGHDLLVQSPTGSGKTFAFGIPMIERIEPGQGLSGLVLAPTRELANQIVDELTSIARARNLRIAAVYGGVGFGPQSAAAKRADIVVATPGRLEDILTRGTISLNRVHVLVLDEADRMLDMGFRPAVDRIVERTPNARQTLFFSATLEGATGSIAAAYTENARSHSLKPEVDREADITHSFVHVDTPATKLDQLVSRLKNEERGRTLVFVRTKRGADRLVKRLRTSGEESVAMHGDKSQNQRERALARFERGDVQTLIATDVAARGIDVADITHVINFDAPGDEDAYVHRTGRTGRAGNTGVAITFVTEDQIGEIRKIARDLGLKGEFEAVFGVPVGGGGNGAARKSANNRSKSYGGGNRKPKPRSKSSHSHGGGEKSASTGDGAPRRKRRRNRNRTKAAA